MCDTTNLKIVKSTLTIWKVLRLHWPNLQAKSLGLRQND